MTDNTMDFVKIDGRDVPTVSGLKKLGLIKDSGEFIPKVTILSDASYALTKDEVRCIVWNLQRFTSATYINRQIEFLQPIAEGFEKYLLSHESSSWIDRLEYIYRAIAEISKGLNSVKNGDKSGYRDIFDYQSFSDYFAGRYLDEANYFPIGYRGYGNKSIGLYAWIEKACQMSSCIYVTLNQRHSIPYSFQDGFKTPFNLRNAPAMTNYKKSDYSTLFQTGDTVPFNGIWNPIDFKSGCPNYLRAGFNFPTIKIAVKRSETVEYVDDEGNFFEAVIFYEHKEQPSAWELLWEDTRYLDGKIPGEEVTYLDESAAFPTDPPVAPGIF
jgi:hypothetical protein